MYVQIVPFGDGFFSQRYGNTIFDVMLEGRSGECFDGFSDIYSIVKLCDQLKLFVAMDSERIAKSFEIPVWADRWVLLSTTCRVSFAGQILNCDRFGVVILTEVKRRTFQLSLALMPHQWPFLEVIDIAKGNFFEDY